MTLIPYLCLLAFWYLILTWRVISYRRKYHVAFGNNNDPILEARVRGHANFAEYVPFLLILLFLYEYLGAPLWSVHLFGVMILIGRVSHGVSTSFLAGKGKLPYRVVGMVLTLTPLAGLAALLLWDHIFFSIFP